MVERMLCSARTKQLQGLGWGRSVRVQKMAALDCAICSTCMCGFVNELVEVWVYGLNLMSLIPCLGLGVGDALCQKVLPTLLVFQDA